jgi:type I restriction enzyme S subunit
LVSADCSISYGIVKTGDDVPGGIPVFRPVDIVGKNPTIADLKRTTAEISAQYKRTLLKGRELLITVRANIGDTCIIGDEFAGCNVGRGIVPIRLNEDIMSLEFLKGQMDVESMSQHIKSLAKGVTLIQLNMEDLRMIKFIVPPVDLQNKYVSLLQQTDKSKFEIKKAIENTSALIKSLMQQDLTN